MDEVLFSREIDTSPIRADALMAISDVPKTLDGLTVVDLAAGASSFVPQLLDNGVDSYAVDRGYGMSAELLREATIKTINNGFVRGHFNQRGVDLSIEALERFLVSYVAHRERYIEAWLSELPFDDILQM